MSIHADKIYRNKENRDLCKKHGIRLSDPSLDRLPNDEKLRGKQKEFQLPAETVRNYVEGRFGVVKKYIQ